MKNGWYLGGAIWLGLVAGCGEDGGATNNTSSSSSASSSSSGQGGAGQGGEGGAGSGGNGSAGGGGASPCAPLDLGVKSEAVSMAAGCPGAACTSTGWKPLTDLIGGSHYGAPGGLYCGSNERPADHEAKGLAIAKGIAPLDAQGNADPNGKYAFISIGMSNTTQEFSAFLTAHQGDPSLDPHLVMVDGAVGAHATQQWVDPQNDAWTTLTSRLAQKNVTDAQVAVAWVKLAQAQPQSTCDAAGLLGTPCFPADAKKLADDIKTVLDLLKARFTNLALVYLSSRIYAGYAASGLNPEPYAYQSGFAVKKLVLDQITAQPGSGGLPWLSWGPYLWADGTTPRSDGLVWQIGDLAADGTHPSDPAGRKKVADMLWTFLTTDTTAREWLLATP